MDNISPALYETSPGQMSSQEFQRMLYTWFEEKGLVADLRSYLRVLMINKLRNTTVGKMEANKSHFSLPKQAFSLVIAEHLLREGCHYTLSIYSTEVPGVANQLPFSLFEAHCQKENKWKFDQDSVLNVLELMGISKTSNESLRISGLYSRNYGSLLTCLVSSKTMKDVEDYKINDKEGEDIVDYINRILSVLGVPTTTIEEVRQRICSNIAKERDRNNQKAQTHFMGIMEEMKAQLEAKDHQIKRLLDEQITQQQNSKKLKHDLKNTRKRLNQMILKERTVKPRELKEACLQKHCEESCEKNRKLCEDLQKEISHLQEVSNGKTLEIERLTSRTNTLVLELHSSQNKIDFLNCCLQRSSQINLQIPKEKPQDLSEDSDGITEEILKEVRSKLQELERESTELELRFDKLKIK